MVIKKGRRVIELTQDQRDELNQLTRKKYATSFYAKRAKVILELDEGKSISEAGRVVEMERRHIYKWVDRYKAFGPKGLKDLQRPGRPKSNQAIH
jgi:transposase